MSTRLLRVLVYCVLLSLTLVAAYAQNNWIGPYDSSWSNAGNWSLNTIPGPSDDVVIYSGGYDYVILDPGSASVNSLTLGGAYNGTYSELTDNGVAQSLTMAQSLTVGQTGDLYLYGTGSRVTANADSSNAGQVQIYNGINFQINGNFDNSGNFASGGNNIIGIAGTLTNRGYFDVNNGDVANVGNFSNTGYLTVYTGATLAVANPAGITDLVAGSSYNIFGSFTVGGGDPFANLNSIEGQLYQYGQTSNITPGSGTLTLAYGASWSVANGSSSAVNGNVDNNSFLSTGFYGSGGNTLNIAGILTNEFGASFYVNGSGDVANVGSLLNNSYVLVGQGATLNLNNQLGGITDVPYYSRYDILGSFNDVLGGGSALANLTSIEGLVSLANGQTTAFNPGGGALAINGGALDVSLGSTININGDVNNSGSLYTSYFHGGGNDVIKISGTLTNNQYANLILYGNGDVLNVGTLVNDGDVYIGTGATLNLVNQFNVTDIPYGSGYQIYGTFNAGPSNAFANLTSIEGYVYLENGQTTDITPNGGVLTLANGGNFDLGNNSSATINGDVDNSGYFSTGRQSYNYTGSTVAVSGNFTNNLYASLYLNDPNDVMDVGTLTNYGNIYIGAGARLDLTNQPGGVTDVPAGAQLTVFGDFNDVVGGASGFATLTNMGGDVIMGNGQTTNVTPVGGLMTISGGALLDASLGSTINIAGDVNNSGILTTGYYYGGNSTINISGTLTNNQYASFALSDPGDVANVETLVNNGSVYIGAGATLNLVNQFSVIDVPYNTGYQIYGTFIAGPNSAFANLTSIEGYVYLENGQTTDITPNGGVLFLSNTAYLDFGNSSTGNISGHVSNSGWFSTGRNAYDYTGSNVTITGNFTNNQYAYLYLSDPGDTANVGTLTNNGYVYVGAGASLNLTSQPGGVTDIPSNAGFHVQGNVNSVADSASGFVNLTSIEGYLYMQNGQVTNITPNVGTLALSSSGQLDVGNNSTVTINGNVDNAGSISTSRYYPSYSGSILNVTGTFINEPNGSLSINSPDVVNIGTLVNNGDVSIYQGATLNLTNQLNLTDVPQSAGYFIYGNFNNNGLNRPFGGLASVEGLVIIGNGQTVNISPAGGTLAINNCCGRIDLSNASTMTVSGNLQNNYTLGTNNYSYNGYASALAVAGTLTNNSNMYLYYASNLNASNFVNNGYVEQDNYYENAANGNNVNTATLTNNGTIYQYDYHGSNQSNTMVATADLVNNGAIYQVGNHGNNFIQAPQLDNAGSITQYNSGLSYGYAADTILVGTGVAGARGYDQLANGTLDELINISGAGVITILNGAPITLDGTLDLVLQSGYNPTPGTSFNVLVGAPGEIFGTFATILNQSFNGGTEQWLIDYDPLGFVQITAHCMIGCATTEFWTGGTGNWNNVGKWSTGLAPTINDDTTIYSGSDDLVYLNTAGSVKSLVLGGPSNGYQSQLTDNGAAQTLTIANSLVIGQNGFLNLYGGTAVTAGADSSNAGTIHLYNGSSLSITGNFDNVNYYDSQGGSILNVSGILSNENFFSLDNPSDVANVGTIANHGYVFVGQGANLNLVNQPGGVTDVLVGSSFWIQGNVNDVRNSANGFANVRSIEGQLFLQNGQTTSITPGNGTLSNTGWLDASTLNGTGTTVTVNGNLDSSLAVTTGNFESFNTNYGGGNTINVTGTFINETGSSLYLHGNYYYPDAVNVGSLVNNWYVFVGPNAFLNLTNQPGGITDVLLGATFQVQGTVTDVMNSANGFANLQTLGGQLFLQNALTTSITPGNGTLLEGSLGWFDVSNAFYGLGTTANINGNVGNSGNFTTSYFESSNVNYGGGSTISVSGAFTNQPTGLVWLVGNSYYPDIVNLGSLSNAGNVIVGPNAILNLTNQPAGITDVLAGSLFVVQGTFANQLTSSSAFAGLTSVEGAVNLYGQSFTINPVGGTFTNAGFLNIDFNPFNSAGSAITINGDINNYGGFVTGNNNGAYGGSTVIINGNLTNNGYFAEADGQRENVKANTLANYGWFYVCPNCVMTLTNQPNGVTDVVAGSGFYVSGSFMAGGNSGFANLNSVEGFLQLNDQNFSITPGSGTFTLAPDAYLNFDSLLGLGSNITIFGNVNSSGFFGLNDNLANGPSTLTITGTVTVNPGGYFHPNDGYASVASLVNYGSVYVGPGGTLTLTNQPAGITDVVQGSQFWISGTFNAGSNNAFARLSSVEGNLVLSGQTTSTTPSSGTFSISNTGHADASYGSTITVNGNVNNSGFLSTSYWGGSGDRMNITGTLTNNPGSTFNVYGSGDMAMVGNLVNQGSVYVGPGAALDPMRVDNYNLITVNGTMVSGTGTPGGPGYYQFADGTLGEHIDISQFGVIVVGTNGTVDLNGTLDIQLASGFNPGIGSKYDIITFTSGVLTGKFASVLNNIFNGGTEKWVVVYNNSGGFVELLAQSNNSTVPEPVSLLLLGTGLLTIGYGVRRRLRN